MIKSNLEPIDEKDLKGVGQENVDFSREDVARITKIEQEIPQEIVAAEKDDSYGKILSKVQAQDDSIADQNAIASDALVGSQKIDADSQVQHLVDIAGQKGVIHAVKVAQHMQDNYVLDTFHDKLLSEELHAALLQKGLIKEL
jgi:hypothetical protein